MRRSKTLARVTAGMLLAVAGGTAAAQDTTTFQVTANVIAFCDVTAEDMDFGDFDGTVDLLATSEISVTCTEDHPYQVTLNAGSAAGSTVANRLLSNGTDTLAYSLYRDPARTLPWGDTGADDVDGVGQGLTTPVDHTVYGRLPFAPNQDASTGLYSSTITVTVNF